MTPYHSARYPHKLYSQLSDGQYRVLSRVNSMLLGGEGIWQSHYLYSWTIMAVKNSGIAWDKRR